MSNDNPDDATELVMQKDGSHVEIWAVVNGHQVFHAEPHYQAVKGPVQAAIQTFLSRAYEEEIIEDTTKDDDKRSIF